MADKPADQTTDPLAIAPTGAKPVTRRAPPKPKAAAAVTTGASNRPTIEALTRVHSNMLTQVQSEKDDIEQQIAKLKTRYLELQRIEAGINAADIAVNPGDNSNEARLQDIADSAQEPDFDLDNGLQRAVEAIRRNGDNGEAE